MKCDNLGQFATLNLYNFLTFIVRYKANFGVKSLLFVYKLFEFLVFNLIFKFLYQSVCRVIQFGTLLIFPKNPCYLSKLQDGIYIGSYKK